MIFLAASFPPKATFNFTTLIAYAGFFISILNLIINMHKYYIDFPKIEMSLKDNKNPFIARRKLNFGSNALQYYKTESILIIPIQFINKSKSPVTIYSVSAKLFGTTERLSVSVYNNKKLPQITSPADKKGSNYIILDSNQESMNFPIRINAYDTFSGYLFVAFADYILETITNGTFNKMELKFKSAYKELNFTIETIEILPTVYAEGK